jgi:hypothetical protein
MFAVKKSTNFEKYIGKTLNLAHFLHSLSLSLSLSHR